MQVFEKVVKVTSLLMQGLIEGTNDTVTPWVCDVRDIARAHVLAAEIPSAKGRYDTAPCHVPLPSPHTPLLVQHCSCRAV